MRTRRNLLVGGAGVAGLALAALDYRAWDRGVWRAGNGSPCGARMQDLKLHPQGGSRRLQLAQKIFGEKSAGWID